MLEQALQSRMEELKGRLASVEGADKLKVRLDKVVPEWFVKILLAYPIIGCEFSLSESQDNSGLGVEMGWLSPDQIISEAFDSYPGIVAHPKGYLPIGSCTVGSGDYYYISSQQAKDPPLLRIPHEAVDIENNELIESDIEEVCDSLSRFVQLAQIEH